MAVDAANDMKHLEQCNVIQSDLREWWHDMLRKLQFLTKLFAWSMVRYAGHAKPTKIIPKGECSC